MTADDFRAIALSFPGAEERAHMHHPDFRVRGKIFATLGYPDAAHGMVKLTPDDQEIFMKLAPDVFTPAAGAWGRQGSTVVNLKKAKKKIVRDAMKLACERLTPNP